MMKESQEQLSIEEGAIAIIGMSGRFPGAKNISQFWSNLQAGIESIEFFSDEEILGSGVEPALVKKPEYVKARGVLSDIDQFDAQFFDFSAKEAAITDPQHRLFTECAWEALENAGYAPQTYQGAIGVYGGVGINGYLLNNLYAHQNLSDTAGAFQLLLGNDKDYLTTRVSYKLNLKGPSVNVQTACSTSLVAVHLACQSLLNGECDMSIVGGASVHVPQKQGYLYQEGMIMSPDGHCRAFDALAGGTVFGSGVGIVVLKRLEDALGDRDCIHGIIKGSAINNDGSQKVGYTAPSIEGQAAVIREAQGIAGIDPETISYIEAHGTGTVMGDPIEIAALTRVFRASTEKKGFCAIGSVKTNVGHLDAAAGVTGLIKTVLALKHKLIPPSLHFETANPQIDFANSPFYVNSKLGEWKTRLGTPRRAGVSSFGIGGTNAHVVLEEAPEVSNSPPGRNYQLLVLSAKTNSALDRGRENLATYLKQHREINLANVAYTLSIGRQGFNYRRMLVCADISEAVNALNSTSERASASYQESQTRSVVFMFSGQGSQYVNMGRELYETEQTFRWWVDGCCELLEPHLGLDLRDILYPSEEVSNSDGSADLQETAIAQPALFVIEYALAQLWMSWGVRPSGAIGHSIGEYVAATIAGVFSLEDALTLVAARGKLMQEMPIGSMLAVPLTEAQLQPQLGTSLEIAAINGPSNCVVSGPTVDIEALQKQLASKGISCRRLHTSHGFHSQMMEPTIAPFTEKVKQVNLNPPEIPYISNVTGTWITVEQATDPHYWAKHLRQPVRFAEGLRHWGRDRSQILLEVGPGRTLSTLAKQHPDLADEQIVLTSIRHPQEKRTVREKSDVAFLLNTLGQLWLAGAKVDWSGFYSHQQRRRLPLPTYPFERQRYWVEPPKHVRQVGEFPHLWRSLVEAGRRQSQQGIAQFNNPEYLAKLELAERLSVAYMSNALQEMGAFSNREQQYSVEELCRQGQVQPRYQQLLSRCLNSLAKRGYLQQEQGCYSGLKTLKNKQLEELLSRSKDLVGEGRGELEILQICGEKYAEILRGKVEPLELLFTGKARESLLKMYKESPASRYFIDIMQGMMNNLLQSLPRSVKLNILEVGAGTGATTESLLPVLSSEQTSYTFTDVGGWFVQQAQQKFSIYPFIEYRVLDLDRDPREQGFENHSFDVIIASQVLHATKNLSKTLQRVHSLLAPGGILLNWEGTQPESVMFNIVFSMLQPLEADELRSPLYPFLSRVQWHEALQKYAFVEVESFPETDAAHSHIFVARVSEQLAADYTSVRMQLDEMVYSPQIQSQPRPSQNKIAPRNQLEETIANIWQEVLGNKQIGIDDNFFDLGGDSLTAVQVIFKLRGKFSAELEPNLVLKAPTISQLASLISPRSSSIETAPDERNSTLHAVRKTASTVSDCLVALQTEGDRLPFFCVHPYAGVVFPYVELARILGHNQPFYGLQSLGLNPGQRPQTSIDDMAAAYIAAMKTVQPLGPYRVGGWSMGSPIAFQMAWQLQQEGETVDRLLLIDTPVTAAAIADLPFIFGELLPQIWPYVAGYVRLQLQSDHSAIATPDNRPKFPALLADRMNRLSSLIASSLNLAAVCQANTQALWHYTPSYYDGPLTLLRTDNHSLDKLFGEQTWGWQEFSSQAVQVHLLPGSHMTLLRSPHVQQLAETLQTFLEQPQ